MTALTRKEIDNFLYDAMGIHPDDYIDMTTKELTEMLRENGELGACYDYNDKNNW